MLRLDYTSKYNIRFAVSAGRPDDAAGSNMMPVDATYQASIMTPITTLFKEWMRLYTADANDNVIQMALVGAAKLMELWLGLVIIPTTMSIHATRFPYWNTSLDLPRGPVFLGSSGALSAMTFKYTQDSDTPLGQSLQVSIDDDATTTADVRLYHDQYFPKMTLRNGRIWPTPLFIEDFPVKFTAVFGVINPTWIATATQSDIAIAYNTYLMPWFQLAHHCYMNRVPAAEKGMEQLPFTLRAMLYALRK